MRIYIHTAGWSLLAAAAFAALLWARAPAPGHSTVLDLPQPSAPAGALPARASAAMPADVQEPVLADQVDRLIARGTPQAALDAYWLLANCATFNRTGDRLIFDVQDVAQHAGSLPGFRSLTDGEKVQEARLCAGMTERMRVARIDYLMTAARAGVPGAAIQMAAEGPFGDQTALTTRPDDPLVLAWKQEVLALLGSAAENGDIEVLEYVAFRHMNGDAVFDKNPALAYRYGVARGLIYRELVGPDDRLHILYAPDGELMTSVGSALSAEQRAAELAAATRIADLARWRRQKN